MTHRRPWLIYVLIDPRTEAIRYVGQTIDPKSRLKAHFGEGSAYFDKVEFLSRKREWMRELRRAGLMPTMRVVQSGRGGGIDAAERRWIRRMLRQGADLLNCTHGNSPHAPSCHPLASLPIPEAEFRGDPVTLADLSRDFARLLGYEVRPRAAYIVNIAEWLKPRDCGVNAGQRIRAVQCRALWLRKVSPPRPAAPQTPRVSPADLSEVFRQILLRRGA